MRNFTNALRGIRQDESVMIPALCTQRGMRQSWPGRSKSGTIFIPHRGFRIFGYVFIVLFVMLWSVRSHAQIAGVNYDPCMPVPGEKPYEMADRVEPRTPLVTFEDVSNWNIESTGGDAMLYRTDEQRLYRPYSGKIRYAARDRNFEAVVRLDTPVTIPEPWDCINFWNYGGGGFTGDMLNDYALIEDADGVVHELPFVQSGYSGLVYDYWFMNHHKLVEDIKGPAKFLGIKFKTNHAADTGVLDIYLGPVSFYKEELGPLVYPEWPDSFGFPLRAETILPENKTEEYTDSMTEDSNPYKFIYNGADVRLVYLVDVADGYPLNIKLLKENGDTVSLFQNSKFLFSDGSEGSWSLTQADKSGDTLHVTSQVSVGGVPSPFEFYYTLNQKSLICGMKEINDTGRVASIVLGGASPMNAGSKLFEVPFLTYNHRDVPNILYADDLFYFTQFDWYYSNASEFYAGTLGVNNGTAIFNGGVTYTAKTDGKRNPMQERLFINISPDVQEVFPTIANPASPFREMMGDRLWRQPGQPPFESLRANVASMRGKGMDKVAINFHEGYWRDGGESYTFKTHTAPGRGPDSVMRNEIQNVKDHGFLVGLYTNYTDFAPVNENWDEDWVLRMPKGQWNVSWSRAYSPKPMKGWEIEKINAPIIHDLYGTNFSYCDVHTAVSPMKLVDYDARVPGAGMFRRTFECYGDLLLNEKAVYEGPVYSEGGSHWFYAGLIDGNFSRNYVPLNATPIFPDFQLLKIHPLEMDMGIIGDSEPEYLAYTLAYGNIGWLNAADYEKLKRYGFLNTLQPFYSMIPVSQIKYASGGSFYNTSEALVMGINGVNQAQLKLAYESGLQVYVNFNNTAWDLNVNGKDVHLPHWGVYAFMPQDSVEAIGGTSSDIIHTGTGERIEFVRSPRQYYMDTYGEFMYTEGIAGRGQAFMRQDTANWIITPANKFYEFGFDPTLVGIDSADIKIETLLVDGSVAPSPVIRWSRNKLYIMESRNGMLRYNVLPDSGSRPPAFMSGTLFLEQLDSVMVSIPEGVEGTINQVKWHMGGSDPVAAFNTQGSTLTVKCPAPEAEKKHIWLEINTSAGEVYWVDFFTHE